VGKLIKKRHKKIMTDIQKYSELLKFRRGDNSTYTLTKRGVVNLVSATPPKRLIGVL
jgi:hypothetical protein